MTTKMKLIQSLKTWIAIYPLLLVFNLIIGDVLAGWPMYARMFVMTIVLVPAMVFLIMPLVNKIFSKLL